MGSRSKNVPYINYLTTSDEADEVATVREGTGAAAAELAPSDEAPDAAC